MKYELFEHEADQGIRGYGETVEEAFENGARALFEIMCNLSRVRPKQEVRFTVSAHDLDALFVEWLNELLVQRDISNMLFSDFKVKIKKRDTRYLLDAVARGEPIDEERHELKIEAKAATYSGLKSGRKKDKVFFQCVVDV